MGSTMSGLMTSQDGLATRPAIDALLVITVLFLMAMP